MKKMKDIVRTILKAARYSFAFCWRNRKVDTAIKVIMALSTATITYLMIQSQGRIFNAVQVAISDKTHLPQSFMDFAKSNLGIAILILALVPLLQAVQYIWLINCCPGCRL